MDFTYDSYEQLLRLLSEHGYRFRTYDDYQPNERCVIMRHDVDNSLGQAEKLAEIEHDFGIRSTYFVLLSSDFYNPASNQSYKALHTIVDLGHKVGLHFDETIYDYSTYDMRHYIEKEARILSELTGIPINCFSLHRPNTVTLETELTVPGYINSYSREFFRDFKYLSDSRRRWREPVEEIVKSEVYDRLHILTHAFWYGDRERSLRESIGGFIQNAKFDRYSSMEKNITDLNSIIRRDEI